MEQNQQSNEQATLVNTDNSAITESNPIIGSLESEIEMLRLKNKQLSESLQSQATEELNKVFCNNIYQSIPIVYLLGCYTINFVHVTDFGHYFKGNVCKSNNSSYFISYLIIYKIEQSRGE